jgi:hypothetical protein
MVLRGLGAATFYPAMKSPGLILELKSDTRSLLLRLRWKYAIDREAIFAVFCFWLFPLGGVHLLQSYRSTITVMNCSLSLCLSHHSPTTS